jgi:hypothetical protein
MRVATPVIPRHLPLSWLCDVRRPRSDVISELRQRVAVDMFMTSHYSGDVTWIRTEVRVVGGIDAIGVKNTSNSIFLTIIANVKKNLIQAITLRLKGKHRPESVRQPRTLESKNAPGPSYYIDSSFLGQMTWAQPLRTPINGKSWCFAPPP